MESLLRRLRWRAMHSSTRTMRAYWKRSLNRNRRKYLSQTVVFDGVPTMRGLALLLRYAQNHGWRGTLQSSDRRAGVAERHGKLSQFALFRGWQLRLPGYLPANPPGHSSHELRSDGNRVFKRAAGRRLPWYELGLDVSDAAGLLKTLHTVGVNVARPYPSGSEEHHVNVLSDPTADLVRLRLL